MPDLKDQMIEEEQEQRERMHQAVDDIEAAMHTQEWYMSSRKTPFPLTEMLTKPQPR